MAITVPATASIGSLMPIGPVSMPVGRIRGVISRSARVASVAPTRVASGQRHAAKPTATRTAAAAMANASGESRPTTMATTMDNARIAIQATPPSRSGDHAVGLRSALGALDGIEVLTCLP